MLENAINSANMFSFPTAHSADTIARNSSEPTDSNNNLNYESIGSIGNNLGTDRNPGGNDLDRDAFLRLLITQLQFQDPLNPMNDTDFIAQLAQFSSLEQMQNMNNNTIKSQAFSMIGNGIIAQVRNEQTGNSELVQGAVRAVVMKNGQPFLSVGDKEVAMGDVVYTEDSTLALIGMINNNLATSQHMDLVGQYAQFIQREDNKPDGDIVGFVEGKIDSIKFSSDGVFIMVGANELSMGDIVGISRESLLIGRTITGTTTTNNLITGEIRDFNVVNGKIHLVLEGGSIPINNVTHVTDSLRHVGTEITHGSITGVVDSIRIKEGVPYLVVDATEISYLEFAKINDSNDSND